MWLEAVYSTSAPTHQVLSNYAFRFLGPLFDKRRRTERQTDKTEIFSLSLVESSFCHDAVIPSQAE